MLHVECIENRTPAIANSNKQKPSPGDDKVRTYCYCFSRCRLFVCLFPIRFLHLFRLFICLVLLIIQAMRKGFFF